MVSGKSPRSWCQPLLVLVAILFAWYHEYILCYVNVSATLKVVVSTNKTETKTDRLNAATLGVAKSSSLQESSLYSTKEEKESNTSSSSCWRESCPGGYPNVIVLEQPSGGAGIRDRTFLMERMANIAGYLCARLVFQAPHLMLTRKHNGNKEIPKDLEWDDFWNVTYKMDGSPALMSAHDLQPLLKKNHFQVKVKTKTIETGADDFEQMERTMKQQHAAAITNGAQDITTNNKKNNSTNPSAFIWRIDNRFARFYEWKTPLAERLRSRKDDTAKLRLPYMQYDYNEGCNYYNLETPAPLKQVQDTVLGSISKNNNNNQANGDSREMILGHLHIRRGDTIQFCDSSIEKMIEYLSCSMRGFPKSSTTLLLGSDEQDFCYRQAILSIIKKLGYGAVDLDHTIERVVMESMQTKYQNNMFIFRIGDLIHYDTERVAFRLTRERHKDRCRDCERMAIKHSEILAEASAINNETMDEVELDVDLVLEEYEMCRASM